MSRRVQETSTAAALQQPFEPPGHADRVVLVVHLALAEQSAPQDIFIRVDDNADVRRRLHGPQQAVDDDQGLSRR